MINHLEVNRYSVVKGEDMSLIISLNSREGIVVAADIRTTIRNSGKIRYSDETTKIVPITNRIVTSFCGNHYLRNGDTII